MNKLTKIFSLWFFVTILSIVGIIGVTCIPFLNLVATPTAILASLFIHLLFFMWMLKTIANEKD
jgi:hypothetical protein